MKLKQCLWTAVVCVVWVIQTLTLNETASAATPMKVLMVTGDWKSQQWYQDVWMANSPEGAKLYRGRFIVSEVEKVAPGQFEFTEVTNYTGQEYLDADYLSQFDVLLLGDIIGLSLNPRFQASVEDYVKNGGGIIYCASYKWDVAATKNTPFANVFPGVMATDALTEDWRNPDIGTVSDQNFKPRVAGNQSQHPIVQGLDWGSVPELDRNFKTTPKEGAIVVLESPAGNPVLTVWQLGKGRAMISSSIFANDEVSSKFGDWKDFGKYYANVFRWLGENSTAQKTVLADKAGEVTINVDFGKTTNTVDASLFGLHGAHDCPGFSPLQGLALENYKALNLKGALGRFDISFTTARGEYNAARTDENLKKLEELELVPVALFSGLIDGRSWVWTDGANWHNPNEQSIANVIHEIDAFLTYTNGKKDSPEYRLRVPYIELLNEPDLTHRTIKGFAKLFNAVADHVHANFPGVKIGAFGFFEMPYLEQFIDESGAHIDWIARHPYGWTGEMLFAFQDRFEAYARNKGHDHIKFFVNEWDFWIMGRQKFDYMMKRNFEAVKRSESLIGTLHYRLGMYSEPIYLFGVLWGGWGQDRGAGAPNTPMHDAYDAFWIFKDFRGARVAVTKSVPGDGNIVNHIHADATVNDKQGNVVIYYDWAYDGGGYKDYANGTRYTTVEATVNLSFAQDRPRFATISKATGEGFEVIRENIEIPAGTTHSLKLTLEPLTAYSITVSAR